MTPSPIIAPGCGSITVHQVQGPRPYQEDFYFVSDGILAVLDGHGGQECAAYCKTRLPALTKVFAWGKPEQAIATVCAELATECSGMRFQSGAALSMVHVERDLATVAILGDAPVIIIDADGNTNISPEHNVRSNRKEAEAAIARGGFIRDGYLCNRSGAGLQMSRALGDRALADVLSTTPEIYQVPISQGSAILVATDGVVDPAHTDSTAVNIIANLLRGKADAKQIIKSIQRLADNATAIVWHGKGA